MKKFTEKVQRLSAKATEIRQFVESVPPKVVEIRDAVTAATGQVQKLRADIASSVATLRSETDTQLLTALREIDAGADVFAAAGFRLAGVEMDLGPTRKLVVSLGRMPNGDTRQLPALLQANASRPTLRALLAALIKAEELGATVSLTHLTYTRLTVDVGLIPIVRIGWRADEPESEAEPAADEEREAEVNPSEPLESDAPVPSTAKGSFFSQRQPRAAGTNVITPPVELAPQESVAAVPPASHVVEKASPLASTPPADAWGSSALARFKKMPDLTKRSR